MPKGFPITRNLIIASVSPFLICLCLTGCDGCNGTTNSGTPQQSYRPDRNSDADSRAAAENLGDSARGTVDAFNRGLTSEDRTAIEESQKKLAAIFRSEDDKDKPESLDEIRTLLSGFHDNLMEVDVSACPKEYRDQEENIIRRVGAISSEFNGIEESDENVNHFLRRFQSEIEDLNHEVSELNATAHKYGATTKIPIG